MSTNRYNTIQQYQPIRPPASFDRQGKQMVIQISEIFDDIYRRFGRLDMEDMSKKFKIKIDGKYDIVSGIEIGEEGVSITGSKYVKIAADDGGEWEYNADGLQYYKLGDPLPFQIARYADKKSLTNGIFYDYSLTGETGEVILLAMCQNDEHTSPTGYWDGEIAYAMTDTTGDLETTVPMGILYPKKEKGSLGTSSKPWRYLFCRNMMGEYDSDNSKGVLNFNANPYMAKRSIAFQIQTDEYLDNGVTKDRVSLLTTNTVKTFAIYGNAADANQLIGFNLVSGVVNLVGDNTHGYLTIRPNGAAGKQRVRLVVKELISGGDQLLQVYGDSGVDRVVFYGNLSGNVTGNVTGNLTGNVTGNVTGDVTGDLTGTVNKKTTTATSFNSITEPGTYAIPSLSSMSNKPSNIVSGSGLLEVESTTSEVWQKLHFTDSLYIRYYYSGTWGSWYRVRGFTGAPTYGQLSGRA